jgi:hypothetical protein
MPTDTARMKETAEILREKNSGLTLKRMLFGIHFLGELVGYGEIFHLKLTRLLLFVKQTGYLNTYTLYIYNKFEEYTYSTQHSYTNNMKPATCN